MNSFTPTIRHNLTPTTTPAHNILPSPLTVCIIGASAGIGEAIALSYAQAHASVLILCSRSLANLQPIAAQIASISPSTSVSLRACDISKASDVADLAGFIASTYDRLDVVVSNPAYPGPLTLKVTDGDPAWFQNNFDTNTVGTYHVAHYLVPQLLSTADGAKSLFVVGSLAAAVVKGPIANTGYCVSKFAQSRLVEMIGEQFGKEEDGGLLVVNLHPGAVATSNAVGNTPEVFLPCRSLFIRFCHILARHVFNIQSSC